jgi:hypothetical protein
VTDQPRKLFIDIETAPIDALVWQKSLYNTNVRVEQVEQDTHLFSYAAKWADEKHVIYEDQSTRRNIENDSPLLVSLHKLLDEADIVIAHNGRAFDLPFVLTRMAGADMLPPSPFQQIDTYLVAKKQFGFTFNSLEFLGRALGCKVQKHSHGKFPGIELWRACKAGNKEAWAEMAVYNKADVYLLEEVYMKLRPWMRGHPNLGMWVNDGDRHCPVCNSTKLQVRKHYYTQTGMYKSYRCSDCGKYSRGRQVVNSKEHRKLQLAN